MSLVGRTQSSADAVATATLFIMRDDATYLMPRPQDLRLGRVRDAGRPRSRGPIHRGVRADAGQAVRPPRGDPARAAVHAAVQQVVRQPARLDLLRPGDRGDGALPDDPVRGARRPVRVLLPRRPRLADASGRRRPLRAIQGRPPVRRREGRPRRHDRRDRDVPAGAVRVRAGPDAPERRARDGGARARAASRTTARTGSRGPIARLPDARPDVRPGPPQGVLRDTPDAAPAARTSRSRRPSGLDHDGRTIIKPFAPPYYPTMEAAVRAFVDYKFAPGTGFFRDATKPSAWRDPAADPGDDPALYGGEHPGRHRVLRPT